MSASAISRMVYPSGTDTAGLSRTKGRKTVGCSSRGSLSANTKRICAKPCLLQHLKSFHSTVFLRIAMFTRERYFSCVVLYISESRLLDTQWGSSASSAAWRICSADVDGL